MAQRTYSSILSMLPLLLQALDEIDDLFAPGLAKKHDVVEAVSASYDTLAALLPDVRALPKAAVVQVAGGLYEAARGALALYEATRAQGQR
jgi:hypothetical protein